MKQIALIVLLGLLSGCASMTGEYWAERWEELPEEEKERYRSNAPGQGQPIAVCDLTDCIFVWIY